MILALFLSIGSNFGTCFNYDLAQLLDENFRIKFKVNHQQVENLYTLYFVFSLPLTVLGGFIITYLGGVTTIMLFSFSIFMGSIASLYGSITSNFNYIKVGRALDGFTAEVNGIAIETVISIWFKGRFLSFAMSMLGFFNSLISSLSIFFAVKIFTKFRDISAVYIIAGFACFYASLSTIMLRVLDTKRERMEELRKLQRKHEKRKSLNSSLLFEDEEGGEHKLSFKMFKSLNNKLIWSSIVTCLISDALYFCFTSFTTGMLRTRFGLPLAKATSFMTILPLLSACFAPFLGFLTVKIGKKMEIMMTIYICLITSITAMYFMPAKSGYLVLIPMAFLGLFCAAKNVITFSCIAIVTPQSAVPLALCVSELISNLLTMGVSYVISFLVNGDKYSNYQLLLLGMIFLIFLGLISTFLTFKADRERGGLLYLPENEKKAIGIKRIIDWDGNDKNKILEYIKGFDNGKRIFEN